MNDSAYELIIIGAGPAGLTAALYAGRYRLRTIVFEKLAVGGQIILSSAIENFPGFPGGISTVDFIERMKSQVTELGVDIKTEEVTEIDVPAAGQQPLFTIKAAGVPYETKSVIVASGAGYKRLEVPGEVRLIGKGVSYCATCDAPMFKDKEVVVVGAGDRALEEALYLADYAKKVTIVHRRQQLRASLILQEKVKKNPRIDFVLDSVIEEITGEHKVEAAKIKNLKNGSLSLLACNGVFVFVGITPYTGFLKNKVEMDKEGFIMTDDQMKTSQEALFACGDCRKKSLYQVVTACAEGAVAAHSAHRYL
ncbi:MAG: thioredoxin-disulfide reductase [Candidatus Omnitrophica bacterium]|nr:thioredoxin-disulfide reductase [Candidatus Omnitrophota bacterium]